MKTTIYEILKTKGIIKILSLILFLSSISNVFSQENESFIECSPPNIPNYSVEEFGLDYLIKNEGLPDNESGGMPIEILYNPAVNYYYAYCGMNLVIIDAGTMIKQRIKISDRGTYAIAGGTLFTDHIAERKIALNTNLNDLYIATEDETLVILDCGTNTVENTFNLPQPFENLIIDLYYNPVSNNIYWMMADNLGNSVVSVFDGEDNSLSGTNYFSNSKFYKITGSNDGNFIYIGMERFDTGTPLLLVLEGVSLNYIKDIPVDDVIVDLLYNQNTDRLYAVMEDNNSLAVFSGSNVNTFLYNIPMDNSAVKIALNPLNNRIYCTGNGELQIIDGDEEDDLFIKSIDLYGDYSYSMVFDPSENYLYCASGINKIYKVHGNYDIISSESVFNNNGTSHCLTINDQVSPHIIVSANTDIGNISFFNSQDMDYIDYVQTGGYISNGFYNGKANEVYLMQTNTNNLKSFINYYDGSTNEKIGEVTFNGTSGSLVSCDFDEDANRLFVASQQSHRLIVIDGVSHTEIANISVNHFPSLVYCIPGNDRLVCCTYDHIYVINKNSLVVEATIPKAQGRIDRVVMSEVNNNKIYGTISILNKVISVDFSDIGMPKVSYVEVGNYPTYIAYQGNTEPRLYCANLSNISIIDLGSFSVIGSINIGAPIVGFEYNEYMDQLYVLSNAMQTTVYTPGKLSVISCQNNTVIKVVPFDAYFGALKFNSVNNMVYFNALWNFGDIDDKMMLYSYNCETQTVASQVSLDLFQNHNECITWFSISNIILNTENNKLYVGNHGFSNASMIQCPTEKLSVNHGWNWISFPRMPRYGDEETATDPVLERLSEFPVSVNIHYRDPDNDRYFDITWEEWYGPLEKIQSSLGYKMYIDPEEGLPPYIALHGARVPPQTTMTLEPFEESWLGYFLSETLDPWEAIDQSWANTYLQKIQTRDWTLIKECPQGGEGCIWRANSTITPFTYGDLVILITDINEPIENFQWAIGEETEDFEMPDPEYYSYDEQASYIPFYVEFDSTSSAREIAVIADGSCYGAAVRNPGDTVIEVNGYFEGLPPGTPLEFETWDGYKSSRAGKECYTVMNPRTRSMEKRTVYAGENQEYYVISMKQSVVEEVQPYLSETGCRPNPFTNSATITFRISETMPVWIEILSQDGRLITTLAGGEHNGGYYEYVWNGVDQAGRNMHAGIYFWRIRTGSGEQVVGKVVKIGDRRQ